MATTPTTLTRATAQCSASAAQASGLKAMQRAAAMTAGAASCMARGTGTRTDTMTEPRSATSMPPINAPAGRWSSSARAAPSKDARVTAPMRTREGRGCSGSWLMDAQAWNTSGQGSQERLGPAYAPPDTARGARTRHQREEPMAAENDVSRRSAEKSEGEPPGQVAQALVERTHALLDQRQYEELLPLSGEVIQRFGEAPQEAV